MDFFSLKKVGGMDQKILSVNQQYSHHFVSDIQLLRIKSAALLFKNGCNYHCHCTNCRVIVKAINGVIKYSKIVDFKLID